MRTIRALTILVAALLPSAAFANHYADFYVIPVASHTPGGYGAQWLSDIAIQNFQSTELTVELVLIESGQTNPDNVYPLITPKIDGSVTIPAGGSVLLKDALEGYRGMDMVFGAILIGSDRPFAVTSRSYCLACGNTTGQTIPAVRDFLDNSLGDTDNALAVAYVPGLVHNVQYRTNLGMVVGNASASQPMSVSVTVRNAAGTTLGTKTFKFAENNFSHLQFSSSAVAAAGYDIGSAEFRITEGNGAVVPYASVVDNETNDAAFMLGQFPPNTPLGASATASSASPFRRIFERMKIKPDVR